MTPNEAIKLLEFNLTNEADEESLKKQFKKMVLKYHPDRNTAPEATEKFVKIKEAYDVLQKVLKQRRVVHQPAPQQFGDGVTITVNFSMNDGAFTTATDTGFGWSQWG